MNSAQNEMAYTTLGRTGLRVSVAGLGCGGFSRLGQSQGASETQSIDVVRAALDLGINFLDTAENYGTEQIVGKAITPSIRDDIVISTKTGIVKDGTLKTPTQVVDNLHESLKRLNQERVEIFHLHAVRPEHVDYAINELAPALEQERRAGRVAHLGITETAPNDFEHVTLGKAVDSGLFDVVMVAFHLMHQNARHSLLPDCSRTGVGTLLMFAVRLIFSQPERLQDTLKTLVANGELPESMLQESNPMGFICKDGGPLALMDAAYRYARHEPGVDVTLLGTGNIEHLRTNVQSILAAPLPADVTKQVAAIFGHLIGVGLDAPKAK
jgi:aryl-alcohol dehydrogenase-like predicted oxidoreductase